MLHLLARVNTKSETFFQSWYIFKSSVPFLRYEPDDCTEKNARRALHCIPDSNPHRIISTKCRKNTVVSPDDGHFFFLWRCGPTRAMASSFMRFLYHTQRRTTVCRTPLDEWSARRRNLYLTTHNTHNKHPCPGRDSNPRSQQVSGRRPMP